MEYKLNISPFLKNIIKAQAGTNCWEGCCPCCEELCACNCLPLVEGDKLCIEFSNLRFSASVSDPPPTPPEPDVCDGLSLAEPNPTVELTLTTGVLVGTIFDYILSDGLVVSQLDLSLGCDFYLDEAGAVVCALFLNGFGTGICQGTGFQAATTQALFASFFECTPFTFITGPGRGDYPITMDCCPLVWDSITFTGGACPMPFTIMAQNSNKIKTQSKPNSFLKTNFTPKKKCNCKDKRKLII
jgi:hypothetical protein